MWVKICGNTNLEDALAAVEAGADAVGFVFAESPRQVTAAQVREIVSQLPREVEKYGVFVDAGFDAIVRTVEHSGLTGVQLHAGPDVALAPRLREHFDAVSGTRLRILRVLHYNADLEAGLAEARKDDAIDAVLVDSRTAKAVGGTGIAFDWQAARRGFAGNADVRLIAAGGLKPDNVAEAIETLEPWGVDVSSGVERTPREKDATKVRAFVAAARAAGAVLDRRWQPEHVR